MLRTLETCNGFAIQKIVNPKGATIAYQTILATEIGNASASLRFATLKEARDWAGWTPKPTVPEMQTKPKSAYLQNQKGYRADSQKAKKRA